MPTELYTFSDRKSMPLNIISLSNVNQNHFRFPATVLEKQRKKGKLAIESNQGHLAEIYENLRYYKINLCCQQDS
jgi:hypothetical protein